MCWCVVKKLFTHLTKCRCQCVIELKQFKLIHKAPLFRIGSWHYIPSVFVVISETQWVFCDCQDPSQCTNICPRRTTHSDIGTCSSVERSLDNGELIEQELCWNTDHCQTSEFYLIPSLGYLCGRREHQHKQIGKKEMINTVNYFPEVLLSKNCHTSESYFILCLDVFIYHIY